MILPFIVACDKKDGGDKKPSDSAPTVAMWMEHSYDKLRADMNVPKNPETTYTVSLAKNETESVNIGLRTTSSTPLLNFKVLSGDNANIEVSVFHVVEVLKLGHTRYTDPTAPLGSGKRFKLEQNKTMAVLVDFKTTKDTPVGD